MRSSTRCQIIFLYIFDELMIPKMYKLTSKDIRYISYKSYKKRCEFGTLMMIRQYPNRLHHQIGVAVSSKLHKSSVKRNLIKRILYALLYQHIDILTHGNIYVKCFFVINCHNIQLRTLLAHISSKEYYTIYTYCQDHIMHPAFTSLFKSCTRSLDTLNFD